MAEQQAAAERARVANVNRFVEMFLSLGSDAMKHDGNRHDSEMAEAKAIAAARWFKLLDAEAQAQREEAALVTRPLWRPSQPTDDQLPDRTIEKKARDWEEQTNYLRASLADLRKLAATERKELESYITKRR
jgi:uncharacterized tellurite resistance protein B-like protein